MSVFGVILVRVFPYSVRMPKNTDKNNSKYEYFSLLMRFTEPVVTSNSHLLSLISECVTAPATVHHAANIVKNITEKLNPDQGLTITVDKPVYALGKQLQWMYLALREKCTNTEFFLVRIFRCHRKNALP